MKGKVKFALAALLIALLTVSTAAAEAPAKPSWVSVKYTGYELRTRKNTRITDGNHLMLVLNFEIKNNSKERRIMTAYFDKSIRWDGVFTANQWVRDRSKPEVWGKGYPWKPANWNIKDVSKFTKTSKGEWYPGHVEKYSVSYSLDKLINPGKTSWKVYNESIKRGHKFKMNNWSLDFQISSKR